MGLSPIPACRKGSTPSHIRIFFGVVCWGISPWGFRGTTLLPSPPPTPTAPEFFLGVVVAGACRPGGFVVPLPPHHL